MRSPAGLISTASILLLASGCASPLDGTGRPGEGVSIEQALAMELADLDEPVGPRATVGLASEVEAALAARRVELERMVPAPTGTLVPPRFGPDLAGRAQATLPISLAAAVAAAVEHNLDISMARLLPAIRANEVVEAEAAFDAVLGAGMTATELEQPQQAIVSGGAPLTRTVQESSNRTFEASLSQALDDGGSISLSTNVRRDWSPDSGGFTYDPNPAWAATGTLSLTRPLLRGAGRDVTRAQIRLARHAEDRDEAELHRVLLDVVENTVHAYHDLSLAWRRLAVQTWLVEGGEEVRGILAARQDFDTRPAQYSDAVATVEQRAAEVIRLERAVRAASDALKGLIHEPGHLVGGEALLDPLDGFSAAAIEYDLHEAIMVAVANRPEIHQSAIDLATAAVTEEVADDARRPQLDFEAQAVLNGLRDDPGDALGDAGDAELVDWVLGLTYSMPLGNRAAEAAWRGARLERASALLAYRGAVQVVVAEVKGSLRDVVSNYALIDASRSYRIAQAENLRVLRVEEETTAGLTPTFLSLKFQAQSRLAQARVQEFEAMAGFDRSIASLERAMGTGLRMHGIEITGDGG